MSHKIAIFDFDGTLIRGDSFILYMLLTYVYCMFFKPAKAVCVPFKFSLIVRQLIDQIRYSDVRRLKESLLVLFTGGLELRHIDGINNYFCKMLKPFIRKKIFNDFRRLKREGYVTILLSASPDIYLQWIKESFGFDILISTKVEIINNTATGKIIGENCKGVEKLRRLKEILSEDEISNAISYADNESDRLLMQAVNKPIWV